MRRSIGIILCALVAGIGCSESEAETHAVPTRAQALADAGAATRAGIQGPARGTYEGAPFTATLHVTEFVARDGRVVALAVLEDVAGELPAAAIDALEKVSIAAPVTFGPTVRPQAVIPGDGGVDGGFGPFCDVLYLLLQPLHLDLLGAVVDLDRVSLDVHAEPGPGNLLGNLLCAVAELLDPTGPLGGPVGDNLGRVVGLLNDVLDSLGGPDRG